MNFLTKLKGLVLSILLSAASAANAQNVTIPDANFRTYLLTNTAINTNGDAAISLQEAAAFSGSIDVNSKTIFSMTGIQAFVNLRSLSCDGNSLFTLDISKNTKLTTLKCSNTKLTTLDVRTNVTLTELYCGQNSIAALDVSKNIALTKLDVYHNQLTTLDVRTNTALTELICNYNSIAALDVSKNTKLTTLKCNANHLTALDVKTNTALTGLFCQENSIAALDVSKNLALTELNVSQNLLTTLDVRNNTALQILSCPFNQLSTLYLNNPAMIYLECYTNQLTTLDVSRCTALQEINCDNNQLATLDVTKNIALNNLGIPFNKITSIDVSKNTSLTTLRCGSNFLTALDVSKNSGLQFLYCEFNLIPFLNVRNNPALLYLSCYNNKLTILDVTQNINLSALDCFNNSRLTTICVRSLAVVTSGFNKDVSATWSQTCIPPAIQTGTLPNPYCRSNIPFTAIQIPWVSITFTAQLSDASGNFGNPTTIGTRTATVTSANYSNNVPVSNFPAISGSGYKIRVIAADHAVMGTSTSVNPAVFTASSSAAASSIVPCSTTTLNAGLSGIPNATFTWTYPAQNVNGDGGMHTETLTGTNLAHLPLVSTTYTVSVAAPGCGAYPPLTILQKVNPLILNPNPATVNCGQSIILSASNISTAKSALWYSVPAGNPGLQAPLNQYQVVFKPVGTVHGSATIAIGITTTCNKTVYGRTIVSIAGTGCTSRMGDDHDTETNAGITSFLSESVIEVLNKNRENLTIYLASMDGRVVKTFYSQEAETDIDVSGLNSGIYLLDIEGSTESVRKKYVINQ
jgi:Leucine-rich repeat (LRR) protein